MKKCLIYKCLCTTLTLLTFLSVELYAEQQKTITVSADGCQAKEIKCDENTLLNISAEPNVGYVFKNWNDGNTDNPRSIVISKDTTLIASFEFSTSFDTISVGKGIYGGSMTGSGVYMKGQSITLTAVPDEGFSFYQWLEDGSTDNPRQIKTSGNATYTPVFSGGGKVVKIYAEDCTTLFEQRVAAGVVINAEAIAKPQGEFSQWSDGVKTTARAITISSDTTIYAQFKKEKSTIVFVNSNGSLLQSSEFEHGSMPVYSGQTPVHPTSPSSYEFDGWTPDLSVVSGPAVYTAKYTIVTAGDEIMAMSKVSIIPSVVSRGSIINVFDLPKANGCEITVYDGIGKICSTYDTNGVSTFNIIAPNECGSYIVVIKAQSNIQTLKLIVK